MRAIRGVRPTCGDPRLGRTFPESGSSCARRRARLPRLPKRWSPSQSPRNRCRGIRRRTASPLDSRESLVEVADRGPLGGCLLGRAPQLRRGSLDSHGLGQAIPPPRVHAACEVALSLTVRDDVSKAIRRAVAWEHRTGAAQSAGTRPSRNCARASTPPAILQSSWCPRSHRDRGSKPIHRRRSAVRRASSQRDALCLRLPVCCQGSRSQAVELLSRPEKEFGSGVWQGDAASDR